MALHIMRFAILPGRRFSIVSLYDVVSYFLLAACVRLPGANGTEEQSSRKWLADLLGQAACLAVQHVEKVATLLCHWCHCKSLIVSMLEAQHGLSESERGVFSFIEALSNMRERGISSSWLARLNQLRVFCDMSNMAKPSLGVSHHLVSSSARKGRPIHIVVPSSTRRHRRELSHRIQIGMF